MNKIYDQWMNSKNVSFKEKEEMKLLTPEEINTYFSSTQFKFGTAGIRGKMGTGTQRLNRFTYTQLADAYGEYVLKIFKKNKKIVIGHDNRKDSNTFAQICANVLSSKGIEVYLFHRNELMPTPIISYAIRSLNASGGIIVTASHNPKEYNGFKVYNPDGGQILPPVAEEITNFFVSNEEILNLQFKPKKSNISYIENSLIQEYFKDASQAIVSDFFDNEKKKYPIVFTGHHGTSCKLLPKFLKKFGFNIKPLASQCFYDSNFVNSPNSNPETIDSFEASIKYANEIDSKIIIGIDPDADRMAICIKHNNIWNIISGNEMGIIFTYYKLKHKEFSKTPYVISSWVSTNLIDSIANKFSAVVFRTGTGFKWMGAKVTEIDSKMDFVVAFEEAIGALTTTINRDKDSFTASLLALEIYDSLQANGKDFIDFLMQEIYPTYGFWFGKTESFTFDCLDWKPKIQEKMDIFKNYKSSEIYNFKIKEIKWNDEGDCLEWILNGENWIKFRMSGTEPKFKIYYNLYGETHNKVLEYFKNVRLILNKMLEG